MYRKSVIPMVVTLAAAVLCAGRQQGTAAESAPDKTYILTEGVAARIAAAAPSEPLASPRKKRKILVYGRMQTHPESVVCCFHAMKQLAEKSGAFEAVCSGDPAVFLPRNLAQFDTIVMNNTHERYPMRPRDFDSLDGAAKRQMLQREGVLKKSLLDFVRAGKGVVGIHGAVAGNVQWPEYLEMLNGSYGGHFSETVAVGPITPEHPICKPLAGRTFRVFDELYMFKAPYDSKKVTTLLALDLTQMEDPGRRPDKDYPVSWIRSYGDGRVFYCSLGHYASAYSSPAVMEHYLAGIQWAIGDLGQ